MSSRHNLVTCNLSYLESGPPDFIPIYTLNSRNNLLRTGVSLFYSRSESLPPLSSQDAEYLYGTASLRARPKGDSGVDGVYEMSPEALWESCRRQPGMDYIRPGIAYDKLEYFGNFVFRKEFHMLQKKKQIIGSKR